MVSNYFSQPCRNDSPSDSESIWEKIFRITMIRSVTRFKAVSSDFTKFKKSHRTRGWRTGIIQVVSGPVFAVSVFVMRR